MRQVVGYGGRGSGKSYTALLMRMLAIYPYRLIREISSFPDPDKIAADKEFEGFARNTIMEGHLWLFITEESRDNFIAKYGGKALKNES